MAQEEHELSLGSHSEQEITFDEIVTLQVLDRNGVLIPNGESFIQPSTKALLTGIVVINSLIEKYSEDSFHNSDSSKLGGMMEAIVNDSVHLYSKKRGGNEKTLSNVQKTIKEAHDFLGANSFFLDIPVANEGILSLAVEQQAHSIRTPIAIIRMAEYLLESLVTSHPDANQEDVENIETVAQNSINEGIRTSKEMFNRMLEIVGTAKESEMHTVNDLLEIVNTKLNVESDLVSANVQERPQSLYGETVAISDSHLLTFLENVQKNAVRFAPNNPNVPLSVYAKTGKNNEGIDCGYIVIEDLFGGIQRPVAAEDGTMKKGKDGFYFQGDSTRGSAVDTHVVSAKHEGGVGQGLYLDERLLYYVDGIRLIPENYTIGDERGTRLLLEMPLMKVSSPTRIAVYTGSNDFYIDAANILSAAARTAESKDTTPGYTPPNFEQIELSSSLLTEEELSMLKNADPQLLIIQINKYSINNLKRLHETLPNTKFIAIVNNVNDRSLLDDCSKENNIDVQVLPAQRILKEYGFAFGVVTDEINRTRV